MVCRRFEFSMSKAPRPDASAATERLQVMASYARIRLSFGAPLVVALCGVKSTAYRVSPPHPCLREHSRAAWCSVRDVCTDNIPCAELHAIVTALRRIACCNDSVELQ